VYTSTQTRPHVCRPLLFLCITTQLSCAWACLGVRAETFKNGHAA